MEWAPLAFTRCSLLSLIFFCFSGYDGEAHHLLCLFGDDDWVGGGSAVVSQHQLHLASFLPSLFFHSMVHIPTSILKGSRTSTT